MRYSSPSKVEEEVWNLKWADLPRATDRALIDRTFNGFPPFTDAEQAANGIKTNVNFLESTKIAHDARRQFHNAFLAPGNFFSVKCDYGPVHERDAISTKITTKINRLMKRSLNYRETLRNVFGQVVIHGVGPVVWSDSYKWVPSMQSMGDVLIPSRTLLTMENLTKFAVYRRYTAEQLYRLTHGHRVDKAWNKPVAESCIKWAHKQTPGMRNQTTDSFQNPEQWAEDLKEDAGFYSSDIIPTINCWDFYYLEEEDKSFGWKRRIILDTLADGPAIDTRNFLDQKGQFLYDSGKRNYADKHSKIIHFQFADGSSIAPFRYHSVRSLGWLLYSICHLQNRLRCKFTDSVFESMLQFVNITSTDDQERVTKLALMDKGIIPEGFRFVPQSERWQVPLPLIETMLSMNRQQMEDNSSSFTQDYDFAKDKREKTATEITAEVTASSALVSSMLQEAYGYQEFQYREIARRFCKPNSRDPDVREFRAQCLSDGVPEEALNSERWDISAERVIGAGNKQMELAQIGMLMEKYPLFTPDAQRIILRKFTVAGTEDPTLALELVPPDTNRISSARHDAQLAAGSLMQGLIVDVRPNMNHIDYVEAMIGEIVLIVDGILKSGGMATQQQITGLQNMETHLSGHIEIIAQNEDERERVREYGDHIGRLMNEVKAFAERLQEQMQSQNGNGNGELDAKIHAQIITAESKAKIAQENAAMKMSQKDISFRQKTEQAQEKHQIEMANRIRETQVSEASTDIKTSAEIEREKARASAEPKESTSTE